MRTALLPAGWDVKAVFVPEELRYWNTYSPSLRDDCAVELPVSGEDVRLQSQRFVEWVSDQDVRLVIPMSSRMGLSAVPHLPGHVHVVTRNVGITPFTYRLATAQLPYTDRIVHTSPRQRQDLCSRYRVPANQLFHIPNTFGCEFTTVNRLPRSAALHVVFIDRFCEEEKGLSFVPAILRRLDHAGIDWRLSIVGAGQDETAFQDALLGWKSSGRVNFLGHIPTFEVANLLAEADVLLKPTRQEGFPNSLLEAMAAGVVPVCTRIHGVTDWIIDDGKTGTLCRLGRTEEFGDAIIRLARDRKLLEQLSQNAKLAAASRFGPDIVGARWI
jgi:glycosyltransferase involved in cell wall biosynthesis